VLNLGHSLQDMRDIRRRVHANRLNGVDGEVLDAAQVKQLVPIINDSTTARYPVLGASFSPAPASRATTRSRGASRARPTRTASTSSSSARSLAIRRDGARVVGVDTTRGPIAARRSG